MPDRRSDRLSLQYVAARVSTEVSKIGEASTYRTTFAGQKRHGNASIFLRFGPQSPGCEASAARDRPSQASQGAVHIIATSCGLPGIGS